MKRLVFIVTAAVVIFAVLRRFGPTLRERAMTKCQEEMARFSETHPTTSRIAA
jgi:hypothetical protein